MVFTVISVFFEFVIELGIALVTSIIMLLLAIAIYVVSRLVRRAQGMDLKMVYDEIPED